MHKVAVYGSLKKMFGNHRFLEGQELLCRGFTELECYTMYCLGPFPGVVDQGEKAIQVEVYQVDDECFERLDRLEGHPNFYKRELVTIVSGESTPHEAWMYIYQGDVTGLPIEATGSW